MIWSSFKVKGKYLSGKVTLSIYYVLLIQLSLGSSPYPHTDRLSSPSASYAHTQEKTYTAAETSDADIHSLSEGYNSAFLLMSSPSETQVSTHKSKCTKDYGLSGRTVKEPI